MRVLLIDVNFKNSSTGKIVYDLYNSLINEGHTVSVCYGRGPQADEPNVFKFSSNLEVYTHAFLTRITGLTGNYSYFATKKLINYMEMFEPDVVHIHELHAYFVNIVPVINYLKQKNIKTVWTFHCEFMYTGKCGHAFDCEKWKSECKKCPQVKEYPSSIFFDFTKKMFNEKREIFRGFDNLTIVTPSNWLANRVKQSFLKNKDIRIIYNGIDTTSIFFPRNFEQLKQKHNLKDEKVILAVAPDLMSEQKGGRWIIDLAKRYKGENIKFILIGIKEINEINDNNVIALGTIKNQQELAEYYSMADLTILTSLKETFSLVCAESLACGTPVVGFDSGAPSEVAPKGFGLFVPYGDIDSLDKAVKSQLNCSNDPMKLKEFSKKMYSKEEMYSNYLELYRNNHY